MFRRRRVRAAKVFAAAFLVCCLCLSPGPSRAGDGDVARNILFNGRDIWRNGAFAYGGFLVAPGGFEQDGFMFKLLLSGGLYRYNAGGLGGAEVIGAEALTQALPGFRIKRGNAEMKFFFGPEWQYHRLSPDDPDNRLRGHDFGLRMAGELWYEPNRSDLDRRRRLTVINRDQPIGTAGLRLARRRQSFQRRWILYRTGSAIFRVRRLPPMARRRPHHQSENRRQRVVSRHRLGAGLQRPRQPLFTA